LDAAADGGVQGGAAGDGGLRMRGDVERMGDVDHLAAIPRASSWLVLPSNCSRGSAAGAVAAAAAGRAAGRPSRAPAPQPPTSSHLSSACASTKSSSPSGTPRSSRMALSTAVMALKPGVVSQSPVPAYHRLNTKRADARLHGRQRASRILAGRRLGRAVWWLRVWKLECDSNVPRVWHKQIRCHSAPPYAPRGCHAAPSPQPRLQRRITLANSHGDTSARPRPHPSAARQRAWCTGWQAGPSRPVPGRTAGDGLHNLPPSPPPTRPPDRRSNRLIIAQLVDLWPAAGMQRRAGSRQSDAQRATSPSGTIVASPDPLPHGSSRGPEQQAASRARDHACTAHQSTDTAAVAGPPPVPTQLDATAGGPLLPG